MKYCKVCGFKGEFVRQRFTTMVDTNVGYTDCSGEFHVIDDEISYEYFEYCPNCHIVYFGVLDI